VTERRRRYPRTGEPSKEARDALKIDGIHSEVAVTWVEGGKEEIFCGDNWCTGGCGLPALIIPWPPTPHDADRFSKASGSQVACGPLMQPKMVKWKGKRVLVPEEHRADFERRLYL
jgi:hypothetical protein